MSPTCEMERPERCRHAAVWVLHNACCATVWLVCKEHFEDRISELMITDPETARRGTICDACGAVNSPKDRRWRTL